MVRGSDILLLDQYLRYKNISDEILNSQSLVSELGILLSNQCLRYKNILDDVWNP